MGLNDFSDTNWGAAKRFRLILREQGVSREMGGQEMSVAVQIVDNIFINALELKASDIHLQPERDQLRIRFRQDGMLFENGMLPPEHANNAVARLKLAAGMRIDEQREPQDGRIDMEFDGRRLSARASCVPCLNGEKFVMRLLDPGSMRVELPRLGMPESIIGEWTRAIKAPYGLILVTGPTGSGKTSTLYASLNTLDSKKRNIVTVEDPIEYEFEQHIAQVQVTERMTFARVMRSFLRQDPDVMMVGEMRDAESLGIGIQAALTGHLVLSTLHTNSALETVNRMLDMDAEPYLVSGVTVAILAQRLIRLNCPKCREPYPMNPEEMELLKVSADDVAKGQVMKGKGCPDCRGSGFKGRVGVFELLMGTQELKRAIARGGSFEGLEAAAKSQGFKTMLEDGRDKVLMGWTTPEEVFNAVFTHSLD